MSRTDQHANIRDDEERSPSQLVDKERARHGPDKIPHLQSSVDGCFSPRVRDADTL